MSAPDVLAHHAPRPGVGDAALSVPRELEEVFRGAPTGLTGRPSAEVVRTRVGKARGGGGMAALVGMVAAAGLAGLTIGVLYDRSGSEAPRPGETIGPERVLTYPSEPAAVDVPLPQPPPLSAGWRAPDFAGAQVLATAPNPPAPAVRSAEAADPAPPRVAAPRKASTSRSSRRAAAPSCARGPAAGGAWCAHKAVMAADQRLRRAYAAAIRRGAPHDELVHRREEWAELRRRALKDPEGVVDGYTAIARRLEGVRGRAS